MGAPMDVNGFHPWMLMEIHEDLSFTQFSEFKRIELNAMFEVIISLEVVEYFMGIINFALDNH